MAAISSLFSAACGVLSQVGAAGGADQKGAVQDCDSKLVLPAFQSQYILYKLYIYYIILHYIILYYIYNNQTQFSQEHVKVSI